MKRIAWIGLLAIASLAAPFRARCATERHTSGTPGVRRAMLALPMPHFKLPAANGDEHGPSRLFDASTREAHDSGQRRPDGDSGVKATLPAAAAVIEATLQKEGLAAAKRKMEEIDAHAERYSLKERDLDVLGYDCLIREAFHAAIAIFEFNVRQFPRSDNARDSLAEALIQANEPARAEEALRAWLKRAEGNRAVGARVAEFRARIARDAHGQQPPCRPGEATGISGPYLGETAPGTTARLFAPGLVSLPTTGDYNPTLSADGTEFYFTRRATILVSRLGPGGWTCPEPVTFSAGSPAGEEHLTRDNKRMYWWWQRSIPAGEPNVLEVDLGIWAADRTPAGWSPASYVGQAMFVSSTNAGEIYVTDLRDRGSGYLARARLVDGKFAAFERLTGGMERLRSGTVTNLAHPAVAPDGSFLLFDLGNPPLFVCFRTNDGNWGDPIDLTRHGLDATAYMAYVSPDGKYVFFSSLRRDIYWVSTRFIERLRPRTGRQ